MDEKNTILIVDDTPDNLSVLSGLLKDLYKTKIAINGQKALKIVFSDKPPDLILLDIMMPEMDGYEVCRKIKKNQKTKDIPVIFITAKTEPQDIVKGFEVGSIDYITKPFNAHELFARVSTHLKLFKMQRKNQQLIDTLNEDLNNAANYVHSLLPAPIREEHFNIDWRLLPCTSLGGDSFGYHWIDDEHFAIYLIDVAGHGVGPALLSVSVLDAIRSQSLPGTDFRRPQQVAAALNETFTWDQHNAMFFTIWYGVYHRPSRILEFASCGHPPAILISDSSAIESKSQKLMTTNPGIGVMDNISFQYNRCQIDGTFRLYVFSDGVFEITQENGKVWELEEFVGFLTSLSPTDASILDRLIEHAKAINRTEFFEDDYTIIEIEFT